MRQAAPRRVATIRRSREKTISEEAKKYVRDLVDYYSKIRPGTTAITESFNSRYPVLNDIAFLFQDSHDNQTVRIRKAKQETSQRIQEYYRLRDEEKLRR